jgi:hypothetical protein
VRSVTRDASGRITGTATRTRFRDVSGRVTGSQTTSGSAAGSFVNTRRDASGRVMGSGTGSGKCQSVTRVPVPPPAVKK